jgi:hypothetical protein
MSARDDFPSRFYATPAEIDLFLRRHFAEDILLDFQRAIGQEAVREAVEDLRVYRNHPDNTVMKQAWRQGVDDAAMQIDPEEDAGYYPSQLLCSRHHGWGPCPGAPKCTPRDNEGATS